MSQEFTIEDCAAGVRNAKPSEVRKVFAMSAKPGMISFASGMPELSSLPMDSLADIAEDLMRTRGMEVMQYGASTGTDHLKAQIIELMKLEGIENAEPEDIIVTTGSQCGLDILTRVMIDPGDVILAEAPSYSGAMAVFTGAQADVVHVAADHEGLIPEELEKTVAELKAQGRRIKFLYTTPSFQNPGGTMMPQERRDRVREICDANHILIAEDNPYGLLGFEGQVGRAMRADDDNVVYLGSFSKMFSPGLRVGWTLAPSSLSKILGLQAEAAVLNPSVFAQEMIAEYLEKTDWKAVLDQYRELYGKRAGSDGRVRRVHARGRHLDPPRGWLLLLDQPAGIRGFVRAVHDVHRSRRGVRTGYRVLHGRSRNARGPGLVLPPHRGEHSQGRGDLLHRVAGSHRRLILLPRLHLTTAPGPDHGARRRRICVSKLQGRFLE